MAKQYSTYATAERDIRRIFAECPETKLLNIQSWVAGHIKVDGSDELAFVLYLIKQYHEKTSTLQSESRDDWVALALSLMETVWQHNYAADQLMSFLCALFRYYFKEDQIKVLLNIVDKLELGLLEEERKNELGYRITTIHAALAGLSDANVDDISQNRYENEEQVREVANRYMGYYANARKKGIGVKDAMKAAEYYVNAIKKGIGVKDAQRYAKFSTNPTLSNWYHYHRWMMLGSILVPVIGTLAVLAVAIKQVNDQKKVLRETLSDKSQGLFKGEEAYELGVRRESPQYSVSFGRST